MEITSSVHIWSSTIKRNQTTKQTKNPTLILKFYSLGHRTWPRMEHGEQKLFSRNIVISYIGCHWETAGHVEKSTAGMRRENILEAIVSSLEPKYNFMCFRKIAR